MTFQKFRCSVQSSIVKFFVDCYGPFKVYINLQRIENICKTSIEKSTEMYIPEERMSIIYKLIFLTFAEEDL